MQQKKKKPFIVNMAIFTVITIIVWVGFDVYRAFTAKSDSEVAKSALEPLSPTLDSVSLNKLQKRVYLVEDEIGDTAVTLPTAEPITTPAPVPTQTAQPTISPTATPTL